MGNDQIGGVLPPEKPLPQTLLVIHIQRARQIVTHQQQCLPDEHARRRGLLLLASGQPYAFGPTTISSPFSSSSKSVSITAAQAFGSQASVAEHVSEYSPEKQRLRPHQALTIEIGGRSPNCVIYPTPLHPCPLYPFATDDGSGRQDPM